VENLSNQLAIKASKLDSLRTQLESDHNIDSAKFADAMVHMTTIQVLQC
jgi:hypothetical protein